MTKAKAKKRTAKVWTIQDWSGKIRSVWLTEDLAIRWLLSNETIVPATITWTEPRRAKR